MNERPRPRRIPLLVAAIAAAMLASPSTQGVAQSEQKSPGLFKAHAAEARRAGADHVGDARGARQGQDGDLHRRRPCRSGRHRRALQRAGRVLRRRRKAAKPAPTPKAPRRHAGSGQQQIRRMEARGSVVVTQKDQRAIGDRAEFDMRTNTVTLIGNVVVTQGRQCGARRAAGGRYDHRRLAHGGIRRRPGRGHVQLEGRRPSRGKQN